MIAVLIDLSVKATLLCLAAAAVTALMRRASAASRHVVWTGMFLAVLALPIARVLLPGLPVFVLAPQVLEVTAITPPVPPSLVDVGIATSPSPSLAVPAPSFAVPSPSIAPAAVSDPSPRASLTLSDVVVPLWLCGVFLLLLRAAVGRARVRQLNHSASTVTDAGVLDRVLALRRLFGVRRPIVVRAYPDWMPMTWGVLRPVILAPAAVVDGDVQDRDVLEPLLVHEVAHIARFDVVSAALTRLVVAFGWFNPLLWLAARQARLERERACDDAVLTRGVGLKASDYANQLLVLAQAARHELAAGSHVLAMARHSQLEARLRSILDAGTNRRSTSRVSRLLAATLVIVAVPIAAVRLAARTVTQVQVQGSVEPIATPTPVATPIDVTVGTEPARSHSPVTIPAPIPTPPVLQSPAPQATAPSTPATKTAAERLAAAQHELEILQRQGMLETHPTMKTLRARIAELWQEVQGNAPPPFVPGAQTTTPSAYVIGVNDLLTIIVWRSPELSGDVRVGPDGKIALPRGNPVMAAGWTLGGLKDVVTAELRRCCLPNPDVIIQVKEIVSRVSYAQHSTFFFFNQDTAVPARSLPLATAFAQQPDWNALWRTLSDRELEAEKHVALRVQIGTSAALDPAELKRARQVLDSLVPWSQRPSDAELFALRSRFGEAIRNLDLVEVRFDNGLVSVKELADAYVAAADTLRRPSGVQFASAGAPQTEYHLTSSPTLSDPGLTSALKNAATLSPDAARADALLALARAYAFTPDMVALYVAAANGIKTDAERARVFAQAIRVK